MLEMRFSPDSDIKLLNCSNDKFSIFIFKLLHKTMRVISAIHRPFGKGVELLFCMKLMFCLILWCAKYSHFYQIHALGPQSLLLHNIDMGEGSSGFALLQPIQYIQQSFLIERIFPEMHRQTHLSW